jgi:hypothetical protein
MAGTITSGKAVWLPHLIQQRGLGVKDLRNVNFKATLVQYQFGEAKAWQPKEDKPNLLVETQALDLDDPRLDNERGQILDKGARNPELTEASEPYQDEAGKWVVDIIPVRGESVFFKYKGYSTFLFQEEYDLISHILPNIQEITINTTMGLSPLFQILAVVKED